MDQTFISVLCDGVRSGKANRLIFPRFSDRNAWREIAERPQNRSAVGEIMQKAETILAEEIPMPRLTDYFRFQRDGNRSAYEGPYFARRNNLSFLVLACVLSGDQDRWFPLIVDYLGAIVDERFWCVPAHAHYSEDHDCYPLDSTAIYSDLFASATVAQVGLTFSLLGGELQKYSPRFYERIRQVALEHTILPLIEKRHEPWWLCGRNNWTPWCAQNLLTAGICLLNDDRKLEELIRILTEAVKRFWDFYPEDGFCDEGVTYWTRAGSELIVFLHRLNTLLPGSAADICRTAKYYNIARFPLDMQIGGKLFYIFADGIARFEYSPMPFAIAYRATGCADLLRFAGNFADCSRLEQNSCGEILRTTLDLLFNLPAEFGREKSVKETNTDYPGRLAILRNERLAAVLKGGDNEESHNHNDLGHFSFYADGKAIIADLGSSEYTRQYFSPERYRLPATGAHGHNAPLFGGKGQEAGAYTAELRTAGNTDASVVLEKAYPEEFKIRSMSRSIHLGADVFFVADRIDRSGSGEPVQLNLYSPCADVVAENGDIVFDGNVRLELDGLGIAALKRLEVTDVNFRRSWGDVLWLIELEAEKAEYRMTFRV